MSREPWPGRHRVCSFLACVQWGVPAARELFSLSSCRLHPLWCHATDPDGAAG